MINSVRLFALGLAMILGFGPAAAGDAVKGEKLFRNCLACHTLQSEDGEFIRKGGKAGPNLLDVIGRKAGSYRAYEYSDGLQSLNKSGLIWSEDTLAGFVTNPNEFLATKLGPGNTSKMPFALSDGAADIAAYLAKVGAQEMK